MQDSERVVQIIQSYFNSIYRELLLGDIRAVYLWGSLVRSEFDLATSDVDCLAICGPSAGEAVVTQLRDGARQKHEELEQLNMRCLYLSDLNGSQPKSELAQVLDPRLLLTDFASWLWISGEKLSISRFALRPCTLEEAYGIRLQALRHRMQKCLSVPRTEAPMYVLKEAAFLSHVIHQISHGEHAFTYTDLERRSNSLTAPLARAISALRSRGWPEIDCEQAMPLVARLLSQTPEIGYRGRGSHNDGLQVSGLLCQTRVEVASRA